jgi:hypothetical protein
LIVSFTPGSSAIFTSLAWMAVWNGVFLLLPAIPSWSKSTFPPNASSVTV